MKELREISRKRTQPPKNRKKWENYAPTRGKRDDKMLMERRAAPPQILSHLNTNQGRRVVIPWKMNFKGLE